MTLCLGACIVPESASRLSNICPIEMSVFFGCKLNDGLLSTWFSLSSQLVLTLYRLSISREGGELSHRNVMVLVPEVTPMNARLGKPRALVAIPSIPPSNTTPQFSQTAL
jgi:hypothetical protein